MKNFVRMIALTLCLLLVFPAALAQAAADYIAGEPTNEAFIDALTSGKLVSGAIEIDLALDAQVLGIPAEEVETVQAVLDAIAQAKLTIGVGLIDQGLRVALEAEMTDAAGENPVSVDALADVTLDGVCVESDLIAGKRLSVKWETLLALAGLDESEIAMVMSLRDLDPAMIEQMIDELLAELEPMIEMAMQLAAPYAETVTDFVLSLPIEVTENLNEEGYPPTATEIGITVTVQDVGTLITLLCDQLEQDNTMVVLLNSVLAEADLGYDVAQLIAEAREAAAQMTDTDTPITFYLGMNENDEPLYVEMYIYNEPSGESIYGGLFFYQDADGVWKAEVVGGLYDKESNPTAAIYLGGSYQEDPADPNVCSLLGEVYVYEGDTPLAEMMMTVTSAKAEGELPAYETEAAVSMYVSADGEEVQVVSSAKGQQSLTAAGGESITTTSTTDTYAGGVSVTMTETLEQLVEPTADGGMTGYTKATETMPSIGIEKLELLVTYASEDIDMAASQALEQIAIEEVTEDQMNALLLEAVTALTEEKLPGLMAVLPQPVLNLIMTEFAAE